MTTPRHFLREYAEAICAGKKIAIFSDNDGTAAAITQRADETVMDPLAKRALKQLDAVIITGRSIKDFDLVANRRADLTQESVADQFPYVTGTHGVEQRVNGKFTLLIDVDSRQQAQLNENFIELEAKVDSLIKNFGLEGEDIYIEKKESFDGSTLLGYVIHTRPASLKLDSEVLKIIEAEVEGFLKEQLLRIPTFEGCANPFIFKPSEHTFEIQSADLNKGDSLESWVTKPIFSGEVGNPFCHAQVVYYFGDDFGKGTDGDAHRKGLELQARGVIEQYQTVQVARVGKAVLEDAVYLAGNPEEPVKSGPAELGRMLSLMVEIKANPKAYLANEDAYLMKYDLKGPAYLTATESPLTGRASPSFHASGATAGAGTATTVATPAFSLSV